MNVQLVLELPARWYITSICYDTADVKFFSGILSSGYISDKQGQLLNNVFD